MVYHNKLKSGEYWKNTGSYSMISKSIIYVSITIIGIAMAGLGPTDNG